MSNNIEIDATDNAIDAVCVYQADRAEIKRTFQVELETGQNEVCIAGLPSCLDSESIRVEGVGNAVIFDVIYSPPPKDTKPKDTEETKSIRDEVAKLKSDRAILEEQSRLLESYSNSLKSDKSDVGALTDFFGMYTDQKRAINADLAKLSDEISEAEKKLLEKLKELRTDDESSRRGAKVTIIVLAEKKGKAELSLWYIVSGASWSPLYDLRAKITTDKQEKPSVSLHYRGSISQSTGEDWFDVALTLSTASPLHGTEIPTLAPYRIGHPRVTPTFTGSVLRSSAMLGGGGDRAREREGAKRKRKMASTFEVPNATVVEGATSSTFTIEGLSNIPSSDPGSTKAHKVTIAVVDLAAKLEWIAVPKEQTSAFLRCQVKNTSQYPLIDGPSSVFMDNNFVCKSRIPDVSPQETFSTSLGVDPSIRITYHPLSKVARNSAGGLLSSKHDISSYVQRMTVKNTRTTAVSPLFIKDQIPVSINSAYKVNLSEPQELGAPKDRKEVPVATGVKARWARKGATDGDIDGEEKEKETGTSKFGTIASKKALSDSGSDSGVSGVEEEGVVEWVCTLDGGKGVDLTLAWDIVAPAGQPWVRGA
ncbi:hypothetical protein M407DRAFT_138713 [Tulasnella calospora MUT 4182]|uniref:Mucoidy inhibitor A n=1 Tax=Tulasnella calospora MUT 4182 TaxID=1051891 RepID=A0A0C3MBL0_9AGAM|nr:hypothetical protein M407DRAFT_138713 [Tulasnella calospora MUT 4182]